MKRVVKIKDSAYDELITALVSGTAFPAPYSGNGAESDLAFRHAIDKVTRYPLVSKDGYKLFFPDSSRDDNGVDIFFKNVPLPLALGFSMIGYSANPSSPTIQIEGYPWSVKISDAAMSVEIPDSVAAWFPHSNTTDDSDPENPVTTRNTFGEAVALMVGYSTHKSTTDNETVIANLGNLFDLEKGVQLDAVVGIDLITLAEFNTFVAANTEGGEE